MSDPVAEAREGPCRMCGCPARVRHIQNVAFAVHETIDQCFAAVRRAALEEAVEAVYDVPEGVPFHRSTVAAAIRRLAEEGK